MNDTKIAWVIPRLPPNGLSQMQLLSAIILCLLPLAVARLFGRQAGRTQTTQVIGKILFETVKQNDIDAFQRCYDPNHTPAIEQVRVAFRQLQRLMAWGGTLSGVSIDKEQRVFLHVLCPGGTLHEVEVGQLVSLANQQLVLGASCQPFQGNEPDTLEVEGTWKLRSMARSPLDTLPCSPH